MARHASPARGALVLAALAAVCCTVLVVAVAVSGRGKAGRRELMTLPLPTEPAAHPRLRAIARVPRSHGYTDAVDFGTLPTASSKVVSVTPWTACAPAPAPWQKRPERRGVSSAAASRTQQQSATQQQRLRLPHPCSRAEACRLHAGDE